MASLFHKHLNNLNKLIEFTIKHEKINKLHFIDVMIEKGQILKHQYTGNQLLQIDTSALHHIIIQEYRAKRICDQEYIEPELKHLTEVLRVVFKYNNTIILKEYKYAEKCMNMNNVIARHSWSTGHVANWSLKMLAFEEQPLKGKYWKE